LDGYLTTIGYGLNTHQERLTLWKELIDLQIQDVPRLNSWDFNNARFTNEKIGGKALKLTQLSQFNERIDQCGHTDLKYGRRLDLE